MKKIKKKKVSLFNEKRISFNEFIVHMEAFIMSMLSEKGKANELLGSYLLEGHTPDEVEDFIRRVTIYVVAGALTRKDIVKHANDVDKIGACKAGQRVVEYLGLKGWYYPDILSGRCTVDDDDNVIDNGRKQQDKS